MKNNREANNPASPSLIIKILGSIKLQDCKQKTKEYSYSDKLVRIIMIKLWFYSLVGYLMRYLTPRHVRSTASNISTEIFYLKKCDENDV